MDYNRETGKNGQTIDEQFLASLQQVKGRLIVC